MRDIDILKIAEIIDIPVALWTGNCHSISQAIVDSQALRKIGFDGDQETYEVVRGHWLGPVAKRSHFGYVSHFPFHQHTWIVAHGLVLPADPPIPVTWPPPPPQQTIRVIHNPVIDPTRFAFDGKNPYIYVGIADFYDAGGNVWREFMPPELPPYNPELPPIRIVLPLREHSWVAEQLKSQKHVSEYPFREYNFAVVMWLANLSLRKLGNHAEPIFRAIVEAGHAAAIPIDNRRRILGRE